MAAKSKEFIRYVKYPNNPAVQNLMESLSEKNKTDLLVFAKEFYGAMKSPVDKSSDVTNSNHRHLEMTIEFMKHQHENPKGYPINSDPDQKNERILAHRDDNNPEARDRKDRDLKVPSAPMLSTTVVDPFFFLFHADQVSASLKRDYQYTIIFVVFVICVGACFGTGLLLGFHVYAGACITSAAKISLLIEKTKMYI